MLVAQEKSGMDKFKTADKTGRICFLWGGERSKIIQFKYFLIYLLQNKPVLGGYSGTCYARKRKEVNWKYVFATEEEIRCKNIGLKIHFPSSTYSTEYVYFTYRFKFLLIFLHI